MVFLFLTSGLFLGWSLGANDAANIFGSAVGSRMVKFRTAAIIASIFVILGATIQGAGGAHTLGKLGAVDAIAGSFTVALAAAITVFWMTRLNIPVSTSQAIVGGIVGWNIYTSNPTNTHTLIEIASTWGFGILLGAIFAVGLYGSMRFVLNKMPLHLLWRDAWIRFFLLVIGAFGAYSLGANNIANVMGVFVNAVSFPTLEFAGFTLSSEQQLFFLGGVAIAVGIITYSEKVMHTVGEKLLPLRAETAMIVVLAQALVLFVFSSQGLSDLFQKMGLPRIPMVPVSSSQVIIGAILGVGVLKGGRNVRFNILGSISLGWIATPMIAGLLAFFSLFFVNNVFKQAVQHEGNELYPIEQGQINKTSNNVENLVIEDTTIIEFATVEPAMKKEKADAQKMDIAFYLVIVIILLLTLALTWIIVKLRQQQNRQQQIESLLEEFLEKNKREL